MEHGVNGRLNRDSNIEERLRNRKHNDEASKNVTDEGNGLAKFKVTEESRRQQGQDSGDGRFLVPIEAMVPRVLLIASIVEELWTSFRSHADKRR